MQCPTCKTELPNPGMLCPECGSELRPAAPPPPDRRKIWTQRLLLIGLAVTLFLGSLALSAYAGLQYGEQDSDSKRQALIETHYQNGIKALNAGEFQRSASEFRYVLQLDPEHELASQGLEQAQAQLAAKPTPTSEAAQSIAEQLLVQAQTAYQAEQWANAASTLTQLRALDAQYRPQEVEQMLFESLYNAGMDHLTKDELESGIFYLDQAVALRPLEGEAVSQRNLAAHYLSAIGYWGVDWQQCIAELEALEAQSPGYKDVNQRIYEAYLTQADYWAGAGEMCPAQEFYNQAALRYPNEGLSNKLSAASQVCLQATPTPISGTAPLLTPQPNANFTVGRLAYPVYTGQYEIYTLYADGRILRTASGADQPSWDLSTGRVVYRDKLSGGIGIASPEAGGGSPLLGPANQAWPSLSPDGQRVAYAAPETDGSWGIYIAPLNGTEPRRLAAGWAPIWSRTGALAYTGCEADGITCGIFIDPNPDDAQPGTRLTGSENDTPTGWAPGGNLLTYMSNISGDWDIFLLDTSGGVVQLTSDPSEDGLATWSPDGGQLAFISNREGNWGLYLMGPDGQNIRRIALLGGDYPGWTNQRLSWSP